MARRFEKLLARIQRTSGLRDARSFRRLAIECLEPRTLLNGSAPTTAIVVGRTLATVDTSKTPPAVLPVSFVSDVKNNQVQITLNAYNEQADDETGVLITDTLAPGVTLVSASPQPDQQGQNLAWSVGTIHGFDRASVTLTVTLNTSAPLQLDTGAKVFATLDAGAVSNATPAATLRAGSLADPTLLASTPDANTTDPFIQEEAAKLDYDPQKIFDFLHDDIGYNSYLGSVRGSRGTLWSSAGNALDVASLGVALMRSSGIPAQYVSGTLSSAQASQLILSMFPPSFQTVGYVPAGTSMADPANDPQLQSEATSHYWLQFDGGGGFEDADPLIAGAMVGKSFTTSTGTFAQVPDGLEEKTEVQVSAEITSLAASLFGLGGQSSTTVLDKTFNDVDLVGHPVTLAFNASSTSGGFIFTSKTNTYAPYLAVGDDAYNSTHDQILPGTSFQEVQTSFPFGSSSLTGVFLNIVQSGPQGPSQTYDRTLFDRLGYANRQGSGADAITVPPGGGPAFSNDDAFTLDISAAAADPHPTTELNQQLQANVAQLTALQNATASAVAASSEPLVRGINFDITRVLGNNFLTLSKLHTEALANEARLAAYFDRPRVVLTSANLVPGSSSSPSSLRRAIDIINDSLRVEGSTGQTFLASYFFNTVRGVDENLSERDTVAALSPSGRSSQVDNTYDVFLAARNQGISLVNITPANLEDVNLLAIPADARARITADVTAGLGVIVPARSVVLNGAPTIAWAEINYATGEYIGVDSNGGHQGAFEFLALVGEGLELQAEVIKFFAPVAGFDTGAILSVAFRLSTITGSRKDAEEALKEQVTEAKKLFKELLENTEKIAENLKKLVEAEPSKIPKFLSKIVDKIKANLPIGEKGFNQAIDLTVSRLTGQETGNDPPITGFPSNVSPLSVLPSNSGRGTVNETRGPVPGPVAGTVQTGTLTATGQLASGWNSTAISSFQTTALTSSVATVVDASGKVVGSGVVAVQGSSIAAISGQVQYAVHGEGSLSAYGPAERSLGVSGNWTSYSATVTGSVSITLTTSGLVLNGEALPAGTFTIMTSSATLVGGGATSSPNFAGAVAIAAAGATIYLGSGTGTVSVSGKPLDPTDETTLTSYSGTINVSAKGDGTDAVSLSGNAGNVLQVLPTPSALTTDQNTAVTFAANVQASFADTYNLTADAAVGWTVTIDASGNVTATPAPGLQGGTYPIQIIAKSSTNPDLVAQSVANVTITPTQPGITFSVDPDTIFTVPYNGAQLPTAFRATIHNAGPATDTFNLTFANLPSGFSLVNSGTSVAIPAGQTGILGLYLVPNPGQPIPPPGTVVTFDVTATSASNPAITQTKVVNFTVPAIHGLAATTDQISLTSTSNSATSTIVRITAVGNVAETVTPSITLPPGVTASGLNGVTVQPGQTVTQTLTLTPDATVALNAPVNVTFTETFGPAATPLTTTASVSLVVRSAQVLAVQQAAGAVASIPNSQVGTNLSELADALAQLQGSPTSATLLNRVQFLLENINTLLQSDPAVASFATGIQPLQAAANAGDVNGLLGQTTAFFSGLTSVLAQEADQQFTATLSPLETDLSPGQGTTFNLQLTSESKDPISLALGVANLPTGITATPGQTQVTLAPGQTLAVPVTLSQTVQSTKVFTLQVTAAASLVQDVATAVVAIRPAAADVLSVTTSPGTVNPGSPVSISAQVFNTANDARNLLAHVDLLDGSGHVLKSASDTPASLVPGFDATTVILPAIDSTGLGVGVYYARVSLRASDGGAIPGHAAQASFLVGIAVSASISASTAVVPPGTSTVTTTIRVSGDNGVGNPGTAPQTMPFGDIKAFYGSPNPYGLSEFLDGTVFVIDDTSTQDIVGGVLSINPPGGPRDSFQVGTIPAGGHVIIQPGISDDGGKNHTYFQVTGRLRDESESGPTSDLTQLEFTGGSGGFTIDTGIFTPAATDGPSIDDPSYNVNFLGGNGNASSDHDAPNRDFAVKPVATLTGTAANSIELYYTRFSGNPSVQKVQVSYDGSSLNVATPVTVTQNVRADGAIFLPDGRLVVANGTVSFINPLTGTFTSVNGFEAEHLALDPSGTKIWTSAQPGSLIEIPLSTSPTEIYHKIKGDDRDVTQLAFDAQGNAYYTTGGQNGYGNVGTIDLTTFTTKQFLTNLPGAHGIIFDPFTGDLFIVNINHITQIDPATMTVVSDYVDPNGSAFDQGSVDGKGHIYVADAGNGNLEFVDYSKTRLVGDPSNFHAAPFVTSTLDDVAPLVGLGSLGILTDVSENLAPTGFTVDAKSITPAPSSSSATNVEWFGNIALTDASSHQFQLTGTVANVAPGEVREISTGSTVVAQATVASGQQLTNTVNLPPVFVAGQHIISLSPPAQTVDKNATATFVVKLTNPLPTSETYTLSTLGLDGLTTGLATSVVVPAGQSVTTPLAVTVPTSSTAGTRVFLVSVTSTDGATDSVEGQLTVSPMIATATEAVNLQISPAQQTVGQGTSTTFDLLVTNVGDVASTYSLAGVFPPNVTAVFSPPSILVAPGAGNARHVALTLSATNAAAAGSFPFSVSAVSTTDPNAKSSANATLNVVNLGVQVVLTPSSANPGDTLQLKVTNTGTVADTYSLTLGGPAALVSSLAMDHVTLGPGASVVVPITTTTVNFAVPGSLNLIAAATSQANPAVQSAATSALIIAGTHGLGSSLAPAVKVLPIPGTTDFLLEVNNTGNVEDSYSAVITGTSGPLTASLMGPEGNPTQTIPLFRLPGLSTGAILIHAGIASTATGTVSVRVTSISNSAMTTSQTATLTAVASTATTTQLTIAPNPGAIGEPITFIAVVAPATGTGTPTGFVTFTLDGAAQAPVSLRVVNGQDEATFTTSTLLAGSHTVSASYGGDPQFTASLGGPSTLKVNAQAPTMTTSSMLLLTPNPSTVGQLVTFTAIVSPTTGTATPTGTVTFRIDGAIQVPVVLHVVGERDVATFTTSMLSAGSHTIAASYSGDSQFSASLANPAVQVVAAGSADGPRVASLQRFGFHEMPTTLVLTFDGPLDPTRAQNLANYVIIDRHGHQVAVTSATYEAATGRVVLHTGRRLNVHRSYTLTVRGTGPNGISGLNGLLLDGHGDGSPGGDYHAVVDRSKLVIGMATPKFAHFKATTKPQRHSAHVSR